MMNWTPEQQKEHRKLWVEALRSGKYQQGQGSLHSGNKFCCLGVACEVSGLGKWKALSDTHKKQYVIEGSEPGVNYLPRDVMHWLGFPRWNPPVSFGGTNTYLSDLNDEGTSFTTIADIIESEPPGLIAPVQP